MAREIFVGIMCFAAGVAAMDTVNDYRTNKTFIPVAPMRSEMAPIRPLCREPSRGWIAKQPDGGGWSVHCLKGIRA